jgi:hypothetical protein
MAPPYIFFGEPWPKIYPYYEYFHQIFCMIHAKLRNGPDMSEGIDKEMTKKYFFIGQEGMPGKKKCKKIRQKSILLLRG